MSPCMKKAFAMFPFRKFTTNETDRIVAALLARMRTTRPHVVQHLRAGNWLSGKALIFES